MSTTPRSLAVLAVLGLGALLPGHASAQTGPSTLYVAPDGSDTASGTSSADPLKTLNAALKLATGGQRVVLAPGQYAAGMDQARRTDDVDIEGAGADRTSVAGLSVFGGQRLHLSGIRFTASVKINGHPVRHAAQPATDVSIDDSEFVGAGVSIKEGSQDIAVRDNWFHDAYSAISGPGNPYRSRGITISGNTIERMTSDGIQFGAWDEVVITRNVVRDTRDPANSIHNDAIQMTGNSAGVEISRNRLLDSRSQILLIQDAIGPIDDVQVVNNLMSGAGAVAFQIQGATRATIASNTIWGAKDGGLWLRKGYVRGGVSVVPTDTVMANNLATTIKRMEGAATSAAAGNVVLCPSKYSGVTVPAGATCVADPQFVDVAADELALAADSATRALGDPLAMPAVDLTGALRSGTVPGAFR